MTDEARRQKSLHDPAHGYNFLRQPGIANASVEPGNSRKC
jgi:hypothetical protein